MGFHVQLVPGSVIVELTGWDLLANLRRRVGVDITKLVIVRIERRAEVEALIDQRCDL